MRDYYEELWERLPDELRPSDFRRRLEFLRPAVRPGARVLDVGCGDGAFTAAIAGWAAKPVGIEVAQGAIDRAQARHAELDFRRVEFDGELPFEDGAFELVWAGEVIEHVGDTAKWLSEIRRVLRPRGRLLVTTPSHGRLRLALGGIERFSQPLGDHLHLYTRASLGQLLTEFGFSAEVRAVAGPPLLRRLLLASAAR